jgi:hypothetical protein
MPSLPKRARPGTANGKGRSGATLSALDLAAGLRGLAGVAGNQAMVGMLARQKGHEVDGPTMEKESEEGVDYESILASIRLLLDSAAELIESAAEASGPEELFKEVMEHLKALMASLHAALEPSDAYDGSLATMFDELESAGHSPGKNKLEAAMEILQLLVAQGEKVHGKMADQLPPSGQELDHAPTVPAELIEELKKMLLDPMERLRTDTPAEDEHSKDGGGGYQAAALGSLSVAELLERQKRRKH